MPSRTKPPDPVYGQVWRWVGAASPIMLIRATNDNGQWDALWLDRLHPVLNNWTGLRPGDILGGWEFIEGVEDAGE